MRNKIKVLVVDDSALMRRQLRMVLESDNNFIIRTARNGKEAIEENLSFEPDVITLDINMPEMDGITALSHLMVSRKVPVVMVSSLTEKGALATFEALALGAVDYIAKPGGTISLSIDEVAPTLIEKVKAAAGANIRSKLSQIESSKSSKIPRSPDVKLPTSLPSKQASSERIILMGVSTGGPGTVEEIIRNLRPDFSTPIVIAQHMPGSFTQAFAQRLDRHYDFQIQEVSRPVPIEPNNIYIARGGADIIVASRGGRPVLLSRPESKEHLWHPSIELLGRTTLEHYVAEKIIAVMLTGMGYDGADAFAEIKKHGGKTIAESEDSAIVFGMPKELIERDGATKILHAQQIAKQLETWTL